MIREDAQHELQRLYRGNKREHMLTPERTDALLARYEHHPVSVLRAAVDQLLAEPMMPSADRMDAAMEDAAGEERKRAQRERDIDHKHDIFAPTYTPAPDNPADKLYAYMNHRLMHLVLDGGVNPGQLPMMQSNLDLMWNMGEGESWLAEINRLHGAPKSTDDRAAHKCGGMCRECRQARREARERGEADAEDALNRPLTAEEELERERQLGAWRAEQARAHKIATGPSESLSDG